MRPAFSPHSRECHRSGSLRTWNIANTTIREASGIKKTEYGKRQRSRETSEPCGTAATNSALPRRGTALSLAT
jgi:hypothetical protein